MLRALNYFLPVTLISWLLYILVRISRNEVPQSMELPQKLHPPDPEQPLPASFSILHLYRKAAICSDSNTCSNIGREILLAGGSAVDGALATLLCNGLMAMQSMGLGGGLLMNIYIQAEQRSYSILARERAPRAINKSLFQSDKIRSAHTIAVPYEVMGYAEAHKKFSYLPWAELVKPTLQLCRTGFRLTKHQHDALKANQDNVLQDKHLRRTFVDFNTGRFHAVNTHIMPSQILCDTYEMLAENGPKDFYSGQLSNLLLADLNELGSTIEERDLSSASVELKTSIVIPVVGGFKLHLVPPPGSGHIIGLIINILQKFHKYFECVKPELNATDIHRIVEALKFGFVKRWQLDEDTDQKFLNNLTTPAYAEHLASFIDDNLIHTDPSHYGANMQLLSRVEHGTAHVSVLAPNGDAVSATSSINFYFGSGLTGDRTAVLFNNALSDFAIEGQRNYFGLPNVAGRNRLRPERSPMSSMTPIIVTDQHERVHLVVGAAGGTKIISALIPLLVRILWLKQDIKQAIDAARFHHQLLPDVLEYEFGLVEHLVSALKQRGHKTKRYRERGSAICGIARNDEGVYANADYRKDGGVAGF